MTIDTPQTGLEIRSLVTLEGELEVSLTEVAIPELAPTQVLLSVEAAPINPSDLGLLFAGADMTSASVGGTPERPVVTAPLESGAMRALAARQGQSLPVGNEGSGTVIAAGSSPDAQALVGRTVAVAGGSMYAEYRCVDVSMCLVLPEGTAARAGASAFVNPLTALGMVETTRREGYSALVHTAAASNLGQMLVRLCQEEEVSLVNIVRTLEQEEILRGLGAVHVCNSSSSSFMSDLIEAIEATSATLAFDATGGGTLASQILTAMEVAFSKDAASYSRYGSSTHKQVYIYGGLDRSPTVLTRSFGFAWGLGGWLLTPFLMGLEPERFAALRDRVATSLTTTFASSYAREVSLREALQPDAFLAYARQATGEKFLIAPHAP
ncbi:MAG TPA: zinc-binding dehydrogenase [Acidimicrobiales bacterium]|nr:zinc-binding dehydrogenase [Acidimicrobiales bacterium]